MTSVDFYFNAADKSMLVAQLLHKALQQHRMATVFVADEAAASQLSAYLWQAQPSSFIANVCAEDALASQTPVVLDWQAKTIFQDDILINLQAAQPSFFSRFKRLIEIVGLEEADKAEARKRYAFYRDRGYTIKSVDLSKPS